MEILLVIPVVICRTKKHHFSTLISGKEMFKKIQILPGVFAMIELMVIITTIAIVVTVVVPAFIG